LANCSHTQCTSLYQSPGSINLIPALAGKPQANVTTA